MSLVHSHTVGVACQSYIMNVPHIYKICVVGGTFEEAREKLLANPFVKEHGLNEDVVLLAIGGTKT